MNDYRLRIGADENGLGPRLGPMITTAVSARVTPEGHRRVERGVRGSMQGRIGDSKALMAHGDIAIGEVWARALFAKMHGREAQEEQELLLGLCLDPWETLTELCSGEAKTQCWAGRTAFQSTAALRRDVSRDLARLEEQGVAFVRARTVVVCSHRLNLAAQAGKSRFDLDLHAMERLILSEVETEEAEALAICGKVGGLMKYERAFGPLAGRLMSVLGESRSESAYRVPGVGELRFKMDADGGDILVSIASLIGKYVREVLMARVATFYRDLDPSLENVSGYHDPVTARFIEATSLIRKKKAIGDTCFERTRRV